MNLAPLLILTLAGSLMAADPDAKHHLFKFESHEKELEHYSPVEGPSLFEQHLLNLMVVETRLWGLRDYLEAKGEMDAEAAAGSSTSIMHSEVLSAASNALTTLRRTPNRHITEVLIRHLEMYPYDWSEEGWDDLIPNLRKLLAAPPGKKGKTGK